METIFVIENNYIQINQFLKKEGYIQTGGEISIFFKMHDIILNNKKITEKRKKIYPRDRLLIEDKIYYFLEQVK